MTARLDHVVYPLSPSRFDAVVEQMVSAGFMLHDRQVRHADGRLSAFFRLTGGYLEFCSDSTAAVERRCSIWLCVDDLRATIERLPAGSVTLDEKAPQGETEPAWLLGQWPVRDEDDVQVSMIQYLRGAGADLTLRIADNGLFAICGVSLRCAQPERDRQYYRTRLGVLSDASAAQAGRLPVGQQWLAFLSRHGAGYSGPLELSEVKCLVHVATVDLKRTMAMLEAAGFILDYVAGIGCLAQSRLVCGFCLVVETGVDPLRYQARLLTNDP